MSAPTVILMPPEELWLQYSVVGILILAAGIIAAAFYRLWRELLAWIEKQDVKRDQERDKQREWEAQQAEERNAEWQEFLRQMQERWLQQDYKNAQVIEHLIEKIESLTMAVNNHDAYVRGKGHQE